MFQKKMCQILSSLVGRYSGSIAIQSLKCLKLYCSSSLKHYLSQIIDNQSSLSKRSVKCISFYWYIFVPCSSHLGSTALACPCPCILSHFHTILMLFMSLSSCMCVLYLCHCMHYLECRGGTLIFLERGKPTNSLKDI